MAKGNFMSLASLLLLIVVGGLSALAQIIVGNIPLAVFAFPLNLVVLAVWLYAIVELYRARQNNIVAQYLLSPAATYLSVGLLVVGCVVMGLQRNPATTSIPFVVSLFFVLTQLTMVILRGWRVAGRVRWRFLCNHVGLWLALVAGFWGAPDTQVMRLVVDATQPTDEAFYIDGQTTILDYEMQLVDFRAEFFDNGTPSSYEADVCIDGRTVTLAVNHPYARTFTEDIYLTGYEYRNEGVDCIVQVVQQPWKWVMAAGIVMLIAGAIAMFIEGPRKTRVC